MNYFKSLNLRTKLAVSFGLCLLLSLVVIQVVFWSENRKAKLLESRYTISSISKELNAIQRATMEFLLEETIDPQFYLNNTSSARAKYDAHSLQWLGYLNHFESQGLLTDHELLKGSQDLKAIFQMHQSYFDSLQKLCFERGFQDYGMEGKMRVSAHQLEDSLEHDKAATSHLLMLRRHEKDYFLRKQNQYREKFTQRKAKFIAYLNSNYAGKRLLLYEDLANRYEESFLKVVMLDSLIGNNQSEGIRGKLASVFKSLENESSSYNQLAARVLERVDQQTATYFFLLLLSLGLLFVGLSTLLTQIISDPLRKLSSAVRSLASTNFTTNTHRLPIFATKDEIGQLSMDLSNLYQHFINHSNELLSQNEQIRKAHRIIALQKEKMESSNQSIVAAKSIQDLILPSLDHIRTYFPDAFVFFKPRDIVSGDFYWFTTRGKEILFASVDCTGHGVSGAFLSFIANELLNDIVHNKGITQAGMLLDKLDESILPYTAQMNGRENVGMDISLCVWDARNGLLQFAGAKNPLLLFDSKGKKTIVKGDRRTIGCSSQEEANMTKTPFTQHVFQLEEASKVFLFTDGFEDQLGGNKGKRYQSKRLYDLLEEVRDFSPEQKLEVMEDTYRQWTSGSYMQLDDILVMGLTLDPKQHFEHLMPEKKATSISKMIIT